MNLFCFTLDGSTDSIYEPAYSQTLKEVLPKYQCSPALLRRKAEWGGSDPSINSVASQSTTKSKRNSRRSCLPITALDNETEKHINHTCWMSSADKTDLSHQRKVQNRASCQSSTLTGDDKVETDLPAQGSETPADTAESIQSTGRLKKLQNMVQVKKGHQSGVKSTSEDHLADMMSHNNLVLTCIGLGRRTERKTTESAPSQQQLLQQRALSADAEDDGGWSPKCGNHLWGPFECPQPWSPFYHTCHQSRHELWACGTLSLPRASEWDRFESLIQELDRKQPDLAPPQMIRSITDLHLSQNTLTRFGRFDAFRQHSPLMKRRDNGSSLQGQNSEATKQPKEAEASSQHVTASPETTQTAQLSAPTSALPGCKPSIKASSSAESDVSTAANCCADQRSCRTDLGRTKNVAEKRDGSHGRPLKEHRQSNNSLESLYSLNSGQSSSSGVTSGSDCSSNRGSLRLEDELTYSGQFCGKARVHTEFVPSPYDTESLRLKVGDVIDIITKPPMGIWTGMLNGRIGNFKFIYVDVLTEETQIHEARHRSTVQEVLKRLSLEEYSSSLQLNGYQTVDDLMRLREHHLMKLNVTDPEHRERLLTAVHSLQQFSSDRQLENEAETSSEDTKADINNCPRDSGCHMPSDNSMEDTGLHFPSECPLPADTTAS